MTEKLIYIDDRKKLNLSRLHENQKAFIRSQASYSGIVGGYQSGKSLAACVKCITKLLINPGVPLAYYLPTYGLISDMLVPKFEQLFEDIEIKIKHHKTDDKIITPYGEIWMRSMDNPDRIVSYSVGYSMIDEIDVLHANRRTDAVKRISGRNSYKKSTVNCIDLVSTPEGFAFMYQFFVKNANENKVLYKLSTRDNEANLGTGYIAGLMEQYDHEQLKAYIDGEFVNLTSGTVYRNFDRRLNHSDRTVKGGDVLHIGMDFNITNMSSVVHLVDRYPIAVAELTKIYDTAEMIRAIKERFKNRSVVIYPDASGKNRSTSGKSDIQLLRESGFIVRSLSQNPFVRDRVNKMNLAFLDNHGKRSYYVNTNECPAYTEALEKQSYKGGEPDKTSGFDHIVEAAGYMIYQHTKQSIKVY